MRELSRNEERNRNQTCSNPHGSRDMSKWKILSFHLHMSFTTLKSMVKIWFMCNFSEMQWTANLKKNCKKKWSFNRPSSGSKQHVWRALTGKSLTDLTASTGERGHWHLSPKYASTTELLCGHAVASMDSWTFIVLVCWWVSQSNKKKKDSGPNSVDGCICT